MLCYSTFQYNITTGKCRVYVILQDPKVYVETILEVHHKYNALVLTAFNNDAGFVAALDKVSLLFGYKTTSAILFTSIQIIPI